MIADLVLGPTITILVTSLVIVRLMLVRKNNIKAVGMQQHFATCTGVLRDTSNDRKFGNCCSVLEHHCNAYRVLCIGFCVVHWNDDLICNPE